MWQAGPKLLASYVQVAGSLSRCRMEFGRQAARNVVKMYEACNSIQSESFRTLLRHGLDFSAMVTAFCAERPDDVDGGGERLPHDYLVDVVKTTCGQRLFGAYVREQRDILMADLLPVRSLPSTLKRVLMRAPVLGRD